MSVIAIKDHVMALDSSITDMDSVMGTIKKSARVPDKFGGGYIAGVGNIATIQKGIALFTETGEGPKPDEGTEFLWLRADGVVTYITHYGIIEKISAPFFAAGSGKNIALGALAAGATAEEAVRIACDLDITCWEPVVTRTTRRLRRMEVPEAAKK